MQETKALKFARPPKVRASTDTRPGSQPARSAAPAPTSGRQVGGLAIRLWQRDGRDEMELEIIYRTVAGDRGRLMITRDLRREAKRVFAMLEARGAILPRDKPLEALADLLMTENLLAHRLSATPGWHHGTFIRARRHVEVQNRAGRGIIVRADELVPAYPDRVAGSSHGWRRDVGRPARQSTAMSFAILVALAAPVAARAGLPEGALFNFFQDSSAGKTTLARVAASVGGDPAHIGHWNVSPRGVEEYAAAHNGYALILDDIEKGDAKAAALIQAVTHVVTGGQSKIYSTAVQDRLRPLTWFCFGLSTSPESMSALARKGHAERSAGARVRLIDLPVSAAELGGVFDRLKPGEGEVGNRARAAIDALERGIRTHHGQLFLDWRKVFLGLSPATILRHVEEFEATTPAHDSIDGRLRRKFAIVHAAGALAVEHGILDWPSEFIDDVVTRMLDAARSEMGLVDDATHAGWRALDEALRDPERVVSPRLDGRLAKPLDAVLGIRCQRHGRALIGFNGEKVRALFGGSLEAFLAPLRARNGLVTEGRADVETLQLPPFRVIGSDKPTRPRLYATRADVLATVVAGQVGGAAEWATRA